MKTPEEIINWCDMMLNLNPNIEDRNFFNAIKYYMHKDDVSCQYCKDDVSCQYCKYEDKSETDYPCSICKNNHPNKFEWKETSKPNCVTCDHFGNCDGCEKEDEE